MTELHNDNTRINELDGLRGMAILAAVLYHYANNLINADASKFNLFLKSITQFFYTSIDMFFILSGFLLGGILLKNKKSKNFFKTFYLRRIYRILPLYLLLLILVFLICSLGIGKGTSWWFNADIPFWIYFTFLQNIFMGIKDVMGNSWLSPTWSLGVEEQFYLLISFLIYFSPKKILIYILLLGIVCAPIFRYYAPTVHALSTFTYCRFDALFGGILIAILYQDEKAINFIKKQCNKFYLLTIVLLAVTFLFTIGKWHMELFIVNSWFGIIYMNVILLVLIDSKNIFSKLSKYKFFVNLGLYSFSIYLFHEIILGLFFFSIPKKLPQINSVNDLLMVVCCALITFYAARFMYHRFEKKFMALGHQHKY
jgi:peptidoglycan/LPS O-acetylase OafA/YrhL